LRPSLDLQTWMEAWSHHQPVEHLRPCRFARSSAPRARNEGDLIHDMDTTRAQESENRKIGYVPLRWAGWLLVLTSMLASSFAPSPICPRRRRRRHSADVGRSDGNGANPIVVGAFCKNMRECSRAGTRCWTYESEPARHVPMGYGGLVVTWLCEAARFRAQRVVDVEYKR
jgi:hypothetical protein